MCSIYNVAFFYLPEINHCASNPCLHNGNCTSITETFLCQCYDGWKGQTCNSRKFKLLVIDFQDCLYINHTKNSNNFLFISGKSHCDKINPCKNSGICRDIGTTFSCQCSQGWRGKTCELRKD